MKTFGISRGVRTIKWEAPPAPPGASWPRQQHLALAFLTPEKEQEVYRKLGFNQYEVEEYTLRVADVRWEMHRKRVAAGEEKKAAHEKKERVRKEREERKEQEREREERKAKERERVHQKAQQDAASKAKSQALQRAARETEEREREAAFQRALEKRDALAAEAEAAAQAKAAAEAQREAASSRPRKRNYRQRQKHKQQQREAVEAKQLEMKLSITDAPPPPESDPEDEKLCSICMEGEKTHACLPCGHRCLCASCAEPSLKLEACPICRVPVLMRARIFV